MARKSRKNADTAAPAITTIFRVGGYVRLSAEDKKVKGDSIETQQAIIKAFIEEHPDLELAEIYIDNGLSGQSFQRPAFSRMIEDMESGKINCCISKDLSRLGRNTIDTGYYIEKFFPTKGIRYIAITDDYDSVDPNSGGVMVNLKNMVNEHYALEIGRKIRQTKQMNIRKGKFVGRFAPYGFMKCKEDNHQLVIDPYAAPIVRQMFEMVAEGKGVTEIVNWLNTGGILPPKRYYHSIGLATDNEIDGKHIHWNKGGVYVILKNRVYCGDMVQGKFHTRSYVQKSVPKSDWVIVEDTHEGIVSRELFDKVQTLWTDSPRSKRTPYSENIFLRKVFCGHCGMSLKRRNGGKKTVNYQLTCTTRHAYSKNDCVPVSINENDLKDALLELLGKQAEVFVGGDMALQPQTTEQTAYKAELRQLQSEIGKNSHFLKSLYESLMSNDITQDEYREMKAGYEVKIADLTAKEKDLRGKVIERIAKETATAKAASQLDGVRQLADLTAESLDRLVEKIHVFEDKHIEVQFKFTDGMAMANTEKPQGGECVGYSGIKQAV
jgi:DNA invertase Pin-like site-specific DNA recombinase